MSGHFSSFFYKMHGIRILICILMQHAAPAVMQVLCSPFVLCSPLSKTTVWVHPSRPLLLSRCHARLESCF